MERHRQLTDHEFSIQFQNGTLDPSLFTHEAHLRLAWLHIQTYGVDRACQTVCDEISHFDRVHGDGTKFHKTLTVASVRAVWHFIQRSDTTGFNGFIATFPRLKSDFKALMDAHYGFDLLASQRAKREYVGPDRLPFT